MKVSISQKRKKIGIYAKRIYAQPILHVQTKEDTERVIALLNPFFSKEFHAKKFLTNKSLEQ